MTQELKPCKKSRSIAVDIGVEISGRKDIGDEFDQMEGDILEGMLDEWAFMIMGYTPDSNPTPAHIAETIEGVQFTPSQEQLEAGAKALWFNHQNQSMHVDAWDKLRWEVKYHWTMKANVALSSLLQVKQPEPVQTNPASDLVERAREIWLEAIKAYWAAGTGTENNEAAKAVILREVTALQFKVDRFEAESAELSAGQCVKDGPIMGDGGHAVCPLEFQQREGNDDGS